MANHYKVIDKPKWERAACIAWCFETALSLRFVRHLKQMLQDLRKGKRAPFTLAFVHAVCKRANEIEALRYRFLDEKIVLYDKIDTAFIHLNKDTELFKVVNVPFVEDLEEYVRIASKTLKSRRNILQDH